MNPSAPMQSGFKPGQRSLPRPAIVLRVVGAIVAATGTLYKRYIANSASPDTFEPPAVAPSYIPNHYLRSLLPWPLSLLIHKMDDLIITIYPHAKLFIGYATTAISHALKILYPLINSLWLQYPTGVSIFLVVFVGWFLFRLVNAITSFIYTVTKNIFMAFFYLGIILTILNYYNKKAAGVVLPDGNVVPGFDWDGVWADARGFWGTIQNIGGVVMDLLESGSHLEENAWNSGHRNAAKGSQHPIWNDPGSKASGKRKGR